MHSIGDKVMYGAAGVMTIVDIREESFGDVSRSYYVLKSVPARTDSLTFVPVDNERLVSAMYPLLSADELISLLRSASDIAPVDWVPENRARQEYFKKIMESGDRTRMVAMINAIDERGRQRELEGKKNFLSDEGARHKAERLLYSELSVVSGVPEEDIPSLIKG